DALHGHGESGVPGPASGAPTEWRPRTNSPVAPSASITFLPTRAMVCMLATTYGESLISTPILAIGDPTGPMLYGITYIARPFIAPANSWVSAAFISAGSRQLFVGPASSRSREQMKVNSSTRATSAGSERT